MPDSPPAAENETRVNENQPSLGGFTTAGGTKIKGPSKDALEKARKMFEKNRDEQVQKTPQSETGEESFSAPPLVAEEISPFTEQPSLAGFATAGGTKIKGPSKDALEKARKLLLENRDEPVQKTQESETGPFSTPPSVIREKTSSPFTIATPTKEKKEQLSSPRVKKQKERNQPQKDSQEDGAIDTTQAAEEFRKRIAPSKAPTQEWIDNHIEQIVWKIKATAQKFQKILKEDYATTQTVTENLLRRYKREVSDGERSALKKIIEKDDFASRHLVLFVFALGKENTAVLSDGWYKIHLSLDPALKRLVAEGKVFVGQKLHLFGAVLKAGNAYDPLDGFGKVSLEAGANNIRPAEWSRRLGYQKETLFEVALGSVVPGSGIVPKVRVLVETAYPVVYLLKTRGGKGGLYTEEELDLRPGLGDEEEIVPLLRARVVCARTQQHRHMLSVWRPPLDLVEQCTAGTSITLFCLKTAKTGQELGFSGKPLWKTHPDKTVLDCIEKRHTQIDKNSMEKDAEYTLCLLALKKTSGSGGIAVFCMDEKETVVRIEFPARYKNTDRLLPADGRVYVFRNIVGKLFDGKYNIATAAYTGLSSFSSRTLSLDEKQAAKRLAELKGSGSHTEVLSSIERF
ncbi:MAG: uncharacterized protein A8A55_1373 [Amphiamblys sp. WSBS2006]|nr:MAG: uncharacterized protein A8A55_1373 [Amphiamblys sp. WSBS2006]